MIKDKPTSCFYHFLNVFGEKKRWWRGAQVVFEVRSVGFEEKRLGTTDVKYSL